MKKSRVLLIILLLMTIEFSMSICYGVDGLKDSVAKKLLLDFQVYSNKNPTYYNLVMASDKAIGILGIYRANFNESELALVSKKYSEIKGSLDFSTVYFGYSKSGLHFIVLAQPQMTHNFDFSEAMNKIREDESETNFLNDIGLLPLNKRYYAIDVYAEDLFKRQKFTKLNIVISEEGKELQKTITTLKDDTFDELLLKYKRNYNNDNIIENGKWKLYLFKNLVCYPDITITCGSENIILTN
jgi:hypothetical protein